MKSGLKTLAVVAVLLLTMLAAGCAITQINPSKMTAKELVTWGNKIYALQYQDYKDQMLLGPTEAQRIILRVKKEVFIELQPALLLLSDYVDTGTVPPEKLTDLITRLTIKIAAGVL